MKNIHTYLPIIGFSIISLPVFAQDILQINDTAVVNPTSVPATTPPMMKKKWNHFANKYFTMNVGFAFILDHNIVDQDNNSITQVGKVSPQTEVRGDRIVASGQLLFFKNPWRYLFSANFNGLDAPPSKKTFDLIDWNVEIPIGAKGGWLTFGKQREGVGLEYVSPGTQLQFMERSTGTPMFVRQRNIGIRYSNSVLQQKMTYTIGFFNNYWETGKSFSDNGSQITLRVSGLPVYKSDRELMHLGFAYRYSDATDQKLSYRAKPEANTAPFYINTGSLTANHSNTFFLEWIGVKGPLALLAEYINASVKSPASGNPNFYTWQVGGSIFLTGENRRYNKMTGNLGKLIPKKNFKFRNNSGPGAWELGTRFTQSNANHAAIMGGKFNRFTTALSWYPNAHFRYEINYGIGGLDRMNLLGKTNFWQFRVQLEL